MTEGCAIKEGVVELTPPTTGGKKSSFKGKESEKKEEDETKITEEEGLLKPRGEGLKFRSL